MSDKATVIRSTGSAYIVRTDNGTLRECRLKGKMRLKGIKSTNPLAVGDHVLINDDGSDSIITDICDRRNYIVRRSTNLSKQSHIIAANVDQALLIATINHPVTSTVFIDRFLASTEAYNIPTIIAFNKVDLYNDDDREELAYRTAVYKSIGYDVLHISATEGTGIDALIDLLKGRVTAIAGHSGVGKSTLINHIEPSLTLRTSEISEANNTGKHTTTFAEMHHLSIGADIIDTPGVRGFGIINIDKGEVAHYFRDIFRLSADCRYPNCTHTHEPNCAVVTAVGEGKLAPTRYDSYLNIVAEDDDKYRKGY